MTRLQKKCLIAVAGTHLMLVVLLLCSGFFKPSPKPDDTQVLDVIPANIIDAAFRSGVRNAPPPTPAPPTPKVTPPQPQVQPQPTPPPKPIVQPPPPKPPERAELPTPVKQIEPKPQTIHTVQPDLKPVIRKNEPDKSAEEAKAEAARQAREAKRLQREKIQAIQHAASAIRDNTSSSTTVQLPPGENSAAYADYASVVKTVYTDAWNLPDTAASDDANVKVSVTIASDGRVTESHIVQKSGDDSVDESVQRALDRVREIEPFPAGTDDKERTYIINFNLKAKRQQLG